MRMDDRVILVFEERPADELTGRVEKIESESIPCMRSSLTNAEMMGLFGKYNLNSFKLHLQGTHDGFSEVVYRGQRRKIVGKAHHRNGTVVFL